MRTRSTGRRTVSRTASNGTLAHSTGSSSAYAHDSLVAAYGSPHVHPTVLVTADVHPAAAATVATRTALFRKSTAAPYSAAPPVSVVFTCSPTAFAFSLPLVTTMSAQANMRMRMK